MAGSAAAVATAEHRRKYRRIHIGHLPFMSVTGPDPAAALSLIFKRNREDVLGALPLASVTTRLAMGANPRGPALAPI